MYQLLRFIQIYDRRSEKDEKEVVLAQFVVSAWYTSGSTDKSHEAVKKFTDEINGNVTVI
jgi:hypothetical protein